MAKRIKLKTGVGAIPLSMVPGISPQKAWRMSFERYLNEASDEAHRFFNRALLTPAKPFRWPNEDAGAFTVRRETPEERAESEARR